MSTDTANVQRLHSVKANTLFGNNTFFSNMILSYLNQSEKVVVFKL